MVVSVGDLGTDAVSMERNLSQKLSLAETWDAILLLDEADVSLENRSHKDLLDSRESLESCRFGS
jgi:hypothetical protein